MFANVMSLEDQVLDAIGGGRTGDVDELLDDRRLDVGGGHVLTRPRVVVKRARGLVEVELARRRSETRSAL